MMEQAIQESLKQSRQSAGRAQGITSDWKNLSESERIARRHEMAAAVKKNIYIFYICTK